MGFADAGIKSIDPKLLESRQPWPSLRPTKRKLEEGEVALEISEYSSNDQKNDKSDNGSTFDVATMPAGPLSLIFFYVLEDSLTSTPLKGSKLPIFVFSSCFFFF